MPLTALMNDLTLTEFSAYKEYVDIMDSIQSATLQDQDEEFKAKTKK